MVAFAKNFDGIISQLRYSLVSQSEHPLKKEVNELSDRIKVLLTSGKRIENQPVEMLSSIFDLRIKALRWLTADINLDYAEMFNAIFPQIEELKSNTRLEFLVDNILFALRCNQRVLESMISANELSPNTFTSNLTELPDVTYAQFISAMAFANLDDQTTQKIVDWTNASLHIEFVLFASVILGEGEVTASDKTINELAFLVADAAQEYSALATELGILKSRSTKQFLSNQAFDQDFINEQKQLAGLGIDDFAEKMFAR